MKGNLLRNSAYYVWHRSSAQNRKAGKLKGGIRAYQHCLKWAAEEDNPEEAKRLRSTARRHLHNVVCMLSDAQLRVLRGELAPEPEGGRLVATYKALATLELISRSQGEPWVLTETGANIVQAMKEMDRA